MHPKEMIPYTVDHDGVEWNGLASDEEMLAIMLERAEEDANA